FDFAVFSPFESSQDIARLGQPHATAVCAFAETFGSRINASIIVPIFGETVECPCCKFIEAPIAEHIAGQFAGPCRSAQEKQCHDYRYHPYHVFQLAPHLGGVSTAPP